MIHVAVMLAIQDGAFSEYKTWAAFKPGTIVRKKIETTRDGRTTTNERVYTLKSVTDQEAVVEFVTIMKDGGKTREIGPFEQKVPAKAASTAKAPADAKVSDDEIKIGKESFACRKTEYETEAGGVKTTHRIWASPDVPGLMARFEAVSEKSSYKEWVTAIEPAD